MPAKVTLKWRALAEKRRDHFIRLHDTGRWRLYYDEEEFLDRMNEAIDLHDTWCRLAPLPPDEAISAAA